MKLVDIENCDRDLFYKQMGGKDNLISVESAFNMLTALPMVTTDEIYDKALDDVVRESTRFKEQFKSFYLMDLINIVKKLKEQK